MKILRHTDADFSRRLRDVTAPSSLFDPAIEQRTQAILEQVRLHGDQALVDLTERFDGAKLTPDRLAVTQAELMAASLKADEPLRAAIATASRNIAALRTQVASQGLVHAELPGRNGGREVRPVSARGRLCAGREGAVGLDGADDRAAGARGGLPRNRRLHAMRQGRRNQPRVALRGAPGGRDGGLPRRRRASHRRDGPRHARHPPGSEIFGPGNAYVVAAKRLLFGQVSVDLLPGPSELLVLADDSANARFIAADLLAQAEHGSGHERVWLVTTSGKLIRAVEKEVARQLPSLRGASFIRRVLGTNGWLIELKTIADGGVAGEPARAGALRNPDAQRREARRADGHGRRDLPGAGSPTVLGDYMAGPSHTLPTGGAGLSFAGSRWTCFSAGPVCGIQPRRAEEIAAERSAVRGSRGAGAHGRSAELRG